MCNSVCICNCQGLKVEINQQQLTVDFVSQSQSDTGVAASRADFAEELGNMSCRYHTVASDVSERLKQLDSMQLQWSDCESQVNSLNSWFAEQDTRLGGFKQLQDRATVQQAVRECNVCIRYTSICVKCFDIVASFLVSCTFVNTSTATDEYIRRSVVLCVRHRRIQCVQKKRDQNVFGNISDKTLAILMKFDTRFPE